MLKNDSKKIRDSILLKLHKKGIGTGLHYQSIADLDFYKKNVIKNKNEYKNSIYFGRNSFSIPLTPYLSENDIYRVVNTIMEIDKIIINMKNVIITGVNGQLGQALKKRLIKEKYNVIGIDLIMKKNNINNNNYKCDISSEKDVSIF